MKKLWVFLMAFLFLFFLAVLAPPQSNAYPIEEADSCFVLGAATLSMGTFQTALYTTDRSCVILTYTRVIPFWSGDAYAFIAETWVIGPTMAAVFYSDSSGLLAVYRFREAATNLKLPRGRSFEAVYAPCAQWAAPGTWRGMRLLL